MSKFKADVNLTYLSLIDEYVQNVDARNSDFLIELYNIVIWEIRTLSNQNSEVNEILNNYNLIDYNYDEHLIKMLEDNEIDKYSLYESIKEGLYHPLDEYIAIVNGEFISSDDFFNGEKPQLCKGIISTLTNKINEVVPDLATEALKNILTKFIEEIE